MLVLGTTASGQRGNMRKNGAVVRCVPAGHRVCGRESRPWSRSRRGEEDGCRTPGASGAGAACFSSERGEEQRRPWTRRIKCRNPPRRAGDAQTLGVDRLFSLVVRVSSGFVRCRSSRTHRCMQHQIEPSMEQISSGGRQDLNVQLR